MDRKFKTAGTVIEENVTFNDDDIVDFGKINLQTEYDKYNTKLFGGELPRVKLAWTKAKTKLGFVVELRNRYTDERRVGKLAMSNYYKLTHAQFKSVLVHEMIHVKQIKERTLSFINKHGQSFMKEANRINAMDEGFNITPTNTDELNVSDAVAAKMNPLYVIIFSLDGDYKITVTSPSVFNRDRAHIESLFVYLVKSKYRKIEMTVVESQNPKLLTYKIKRSFKRGISYQPLSDEFLEELLEDRVIEEKKYERSDMNETLLNETKPIKTVGDWDAYIIV